MQVVPHGPPSLRARYGDLDLPIFPFASLPTAVQRLPSLSALGAEVWVKRDDRTGALYGGNKVRKLALLLAHAVTQQARRVVTYGAYGSHHCLATATYAQAVGLEARLALYPQPLTAHVLDDLILSGVSGARLTHVPRLSYYPFATRVSRMMSRPGEEIPIGGSSPLGTLGYVDAGLEFAAQLEAEELPLPDAIFVPAGTCGTVAGLSLGLRLAGVRTRIVAVRVVSAALANERNVRRLERRALERLREAGLPAAVEPQDTVALELDPGELGAGYGHATAAGEAALARFAADGVALETTYTAKCAAALLRRAAGDLAGKTLLFWNTFSSVDVSARLAAADPASLPASFHGVLREGGRLRA